MSYEPLHHKYRPQTFAQLVGQEAIATTLTNAINSEKIVPAYLFTGPRGTGKTSSARILAKSLNCLASDKPTAKPCGKCEVCQSISRGSALDVIEIDAASNTGVDNIREIIEKSQFSPVQCRYKVYVIDECHMLSTAAFNALLKTLEEPPDRVIFVLATTDPQRVLPTIISRCQRFDYRRIPLDSMIKHLEYIASEENIDITKQAISIVAQIANGGLRDAESLLDQLSLLSGTITAEKVWDLVGAVPEEDLLQLIKAIASDQIDVVLSQCRKLMDRGREPLVVLQNLANFYLNLLIAKNAPNRSDLIAVTETTWQSLCEEAQRWETSLILQGQKNLKDSEVQLKNTTQPRLWLEVTLLNLLPSALNAPVSFSSPQTTVTAKAIFKESTRPQSQSTEKVTKSAPSESSVNSQKDNYHQTVPSKPPLSNPLEETKPQSPPAQTSEIKNLESNSLPEIWQSVLQQVEWTTTKALLKQHCHLMSFDGKVAIIGIKNEKLFGLASSKINDIEKAFRKIYNSSIRIKLQVDQEKKIAPKTIDNSSVEETTSVAKEQESEIVNNVIETDLNNQNGHEQENTIEKAELANQNVTENPPKIESQFQKDTVTIDAKKAAEHLAKFFNGEIVITEAKAEELDSEEIGIQNE